MPGPVTRHQSAAIAAADANAPTTITPFASAGPPAPLPPPAPPATLPGVPLGVTTPIQSAAPYQAQHGTQVQVATTQHDRVTLDDALYNRPQDMTAGMKALTQVDRTGFRDFNSRDIKQLNGDHRPNTWASGRRDYQMPTMANLRDRHARAVVELSDAADLDKKPLVFCCPMPGCAVTAKNARELSRHFSQTSPRVHGNDPRVYIPHHVFDVPATDWALDTTLACTAAATSTASFYQHLLTTHPGSVDNLARAEQNGFNATNGFGR